MRIALTVLAASVAVIFCFGPRPVIAQDAPPLPPALRHHSDDAAMMSIWRHEATAIDTPDLADAAMRILFALSYHAKNCPGPDAVELGVRVTSTTTTRDGFGIVRDSRTDTSDQVLRVRPEFEELARSNF